MIKNEKQDSYLLSSAIYENSYSAMVPWLHSIGLQNHGLHFRENSRHYSLAEDYLINSKNVRHDLEFDHSVRKYLEDTGVTMVSLSGQEELSHQKITLPESVPLNLALSEAMRLRRSKRHFTGDAIPLNYLATLLRASNGISYQSRVQLMNGGNVTLHARTVSSAGALYPIDIYFAPLNVNPIAKGIYHYHPRADAVTAIDDEKSIKKLLKTFSAPEEFISISQAAVIVVITAKPCKTTRKYGERGLRFVLHEAGSISQNIHLAVAGLGLGSIDCASFYDDEMATALNLNSQFEIPLHSIIIGVDA